MVGYGFRVRARDRISVWAKGWLGFMYYGLKLLKLMLRSGGRFGKKQNHAEKKSPMLFLFISYLGKPSITGPAASVTAASVIAI